MFVLRPVSLFVLVVALAPTNVFAFDHHHHSHHSSHHHHNGDDGGGCNSSADSASTAHGSTSSSSNSSPHVAVDASAPEASARKYVFVTSAHSAADLGGIAGADARCQAAAATAKLPGTFEAWLSTHETNAIERLGGAGPWYTTADDLAFAGRPDADGPPLTDLLDETGAIPPTDAADSWSGSDLSGRADGYDCEGWTSSSATERATLGNGQGDDLVWGGGAGTTACNRQASLICFAR
jgi:hypothetical protein